MDKKIRIIMTLCAVMVGIQVLNLLMGGYIRRWGILPGDVSTLPFIFSAPFIHGGWMHLINNLIGFSIFSFLCMLKGIRYYVQASFFIVVFSGVAVWLLGRTAIHIGASGWIFGLWSLCIAIAFFQRSFMNIIIALFVAVFYGGMVWGVLPGRAHISFESHLFGALAGIVFAYLSVKRIRR